MLDPLYSLRPKRGRHPFWARDRETEKGRITVMRNDLPKIAAHTAAGGPQRARDVATSNAIELRKRIPLARFARSAPRLRPKKPYCQVPRSTRGSPLLDLDLGAGLFELLLDGRCLVLVHAFLDGLGR